MTFGISQVSQEPQRTLQDLVLVIGTDGDHVHFLVQSVPTYSTTKILILKSLTAREVFKRCPHIKKQLCGGEIWADGFFVSTVGRQGNEETIANFVRD